MATRDDLLDAAEQVFVEKGFAGSSMKRIAEMAGVAKSLIYHYFPSKRELWKEVVHRRVLQARLPEKLMDTVSSIVSEGLGAIREGKKHTSYFQFMKENPQFVRMMAWLNAEKAFPLEPPVEIRKGIIENLRKLQEKGTFRKDIDPRIFVVCFMAICEMWFMSRDRIAAWMGDEMNAEEMSEQYIDSVGKLLLDGMAGRE